MFTKRKTVCGMSNINVERNRPCNECTTASLSFKYFRSIFNRFLVVAILLSPKALLTYLSRRKADLQVQGSDFPGACEGHYVHNDPGFQPEPKIVNTLNGKPFPYDVEDKPLLMLVGVVLLFDFVVVGAFA
ncbi:hypothetical protein K432DRAFT_112070 [Lepidopterella palustris CBS 459.81]|uniref:Uncharacterized protein n=1 Tax=Lepidopterella palustris CBS 459.81 TaxID=1314670 RepID=A0A8E2EIE1_9PEZI|nr:hypothetical protein K432DRAFT_112070 [Lepidopterella palustris CBS 459.81]